MQFRRFPLLLTLAAAFALAAPARALAARGSASTTLGITGSTPARGFHRATRIAERSRARRRKKRTRRRKKDRKVKICRKRHGKRRCRWTKQFDGHSLPETRLRTAPLEKPSGDIVFVPRHFKGETYSANIYDPAGGFDDAVLAELDHGFRCKRTQNERAVDPRLYEVLSRIYDHFGRKPIVLVSGHRYQKNEKSRHFHASAMDIQIPGVSIRKLYNFASSLDGGVNGGHMGVGIYPNSGFVHVDFRAPGAKSYRWTDVSRPAASRHKKRKKRKRRRRRNT